MVSIGPAWRIAAFTTTLLRAVPPRRPPLSVSFLIFTASISYHFISSCPLRYACSCWAASSLF